MIDKTMEPYYDILINIFMGIIIVLILNSLYDQPRTILVKKNEPFTNTSKQCTNLNISDLHF